jgi:branched-chain amino acid transport system ATP-binding protein
LLLKTIDLRVSYGGAEALRGVSLEVDEGSIVALIGANGAGKSSTLRSISGLVRPDFGEIWFRGLKISGMQVHEIVGLGVAHAPEDKRLFPFMTVAENIKLGAYLRHDKVLMSTDLEFVYQIFPILRDRSAQKAGTLSGGEQQMLNIARALMSRPRLLLLDEPSLGLSPHLVRQIATVVRQVHERGIAILLVEQNARLAFSVAKKVYLMETGRIVLSGDPRSLLQMSQVRDAYLGSEAA